MAEPNSSAAVGMGGAFGAAAISAALGPIVGPWAMVLVGAFLGAVWAVADADTPTAWAGVPIFLRGFIAAVLFTGTLSVLAAPHVGAAAEYLLFPLAGLLAWQHRRVPELVEWGLQRVRGKPPSGDNT
jgi:MFS family permease